MAFFKKYGNPAKNDKGEWRDLGADPDHPERTVQLRIRHIPESIADKITDKFGSMEKVQLTIEGKSAWVRQRICSKEDFEGISRAKASWALVDSRDLFLVPEDEEALAVFRKHFPDPDTFAVGEEVCLDGHLDNESVKGMLLLDHPELADWIVKEAEEIGKEVLATGQRLAKN